MTNAEAAALQLKWKQRGDPPPHCEHLEETASRVVLSKDYYLTCTFHCRECGEAIVRTYKAADDFGISPDRVIRNQDTS